MVREARSCRHPGRADQPIGQALADVQAQHRQMIRTIAGMPLMGSPVRIDGDRADADLPPPALGEHTRDVLRNWD